MFRRIDRFAVALLFILATMNKINCADTYVSWVFRGQPQQNNSVLTFNMGDTLDLICVGFNPIIYRSVLTVITRGSTPPSDVQADASTTPNTLTISNPGTLIYDDFDGVASGFENFVVVSGSYTGALAGALDTRRVGVGYLRPDDAGTYHCTGVSTNLFSFSIPNLSIVYGDVYYSGGLTLIVNTKSGQGRSTRSFSNSLLTYSSILLGASKSLF